MSQAINLQQSVLFEIASIMEDNTAMKKVYDFLQKLKSENFSHTKTDEKAEVLEDIRQSLVELKLVKQGKIKTRPLEELLHEV